MPATFDELVQQAKSRWQDLTAGRRPWVRVGYGISGQAVGADAAQKAAAKYIQPARFAVVVVGDRKTIEPGIRALTLGPVRVMSVSEALP